MSEPSQKPSSIDMVQILQPKSEIGRRIQKKLNVEVWLYVEGILEIASKNT